jgi:hypothetical protein
VYIVTGTSQAFQLRLDMALSQRLGKNEREKSSEQYDDDLNDHGRAG